MPCAFTYPKWSVFDGIESKFKFKAATINRQARALSRLHESRRARAGIAVWSISDSFVILGAHNQQTNQLPSF
jgi:hypothetical protein